MSDEIKEPWLDDGRDYCHSMKKREFYAAVALLGHFIWNRDVTSIQCQPIAEGCLKMADAIIKELEKK